MTDLTEKIFSLDLQSSSVLREAKVLSESAKKNADKDKDHKIKEVQKLFEEEKKNETRVLAESFEKERKKARSNLDQKMKTFDEGLNIDVVVDEFLKVTKERICL